MLVCVEDTKDKGKFVIIAVMALIKKFKLNIKKFIIITIFT